MALKYKISLFILTAAVALAVTFGLANRPTSAQDNPEQLQGLLESLKASGAPITIQFQSPLVPGETTWTLPDTRFNRTIADIGTDYICFSEPWNSTTRQRCTPFENILGVTFTR